MDFSIFNSEFIDNAKSPVSDRRKPKSVYSRRKQTGKRTSVTLDKQRVALPPGKRISKNNKVYYEGRKNRSDIKGLGI